MNGISALIKEAPKSSFPSHYEKTAICEPGNRPSAVRPYDPAGVLILDSQPPVP